MLSQIALEKIKTDLNLGKIKFYETISSTNQIAKQWLEDGCPNLSLIAANSQTAGKGRQGRIWFTNSGTSLAISLIVNENIPPIQLIGGIAALATHDAICNFLTEDEEVKIKWPNDILIAGKKVSGMLIEGHWVGNNLRGVVIGIGINIAPGSLSPEQPVRFPATFLEAHTQNNHPVDQLDLTRIILKRLIFWSTPDNQNFIINEWNKLLAFKGQKIKAIRNDKISLEGILEMVSSEGSLTLRLADGKTINFQANEVQISPLTSKKS